MSWLFLSLTQFLAGNFTCVIEEILYLVSVLLITVEHRLTASLIHTAQLVIMYTAILFRPEQKLSKSSSYLKKSLLLIRPPRLHSQIFVVRLCT